MRTTLLAVLSLLCFTGVSFAQPVSISLPSNIILPNYARVTVGQEEGLEGGAFIARSGSPLANWYNPAGLALVENTQINASATAYEWGKIELEGLTVGASGSRLESIGSFFGGVVSKPIVSGDNLRLGFSITTPIQWRPGTLDGAAQTVTGGVTNDFGVTTEVELSRMIPGLAAGMRVGSNIRLGAGLGVAVTSLTQRQTIVIRQNSADSARTAVRSATSDGSAADALFHAGVQWDFGPKVTVGAKLVSPGLRLWGSSKLSYQAGVYEGDSYQDVLFRDPEAEFDYRIPVEAGLGVGLRLGRGEVEADVTYHGSTDPYSLYESVLTGTRTTSTGGVPAVTEPGLEPSENEWQSVTNVAVGGNYRISEHVRLHTGFYTDQSPVADAASSFFWKVDQIGWTGGASWQGTRFAGTLGLGYSSGESDSHLATDPTTGLTAETKLKVTSLRVAYALSFTF